jgi:hypothetical protein
MDATAVSEEIKEIRARLAEINEARTRLPEDSFTIRVDLVDEEHRLQARLGELRDLAARAGAGFSRQKAPAQTDLTHAPTLPQR